MPERELAVEPGQQVEAEDRQPVDHDHGQLEDHEIRRDEGEQQPDGDQRADREVARARTPGYRRALRRDEGFGVDSLARRDHTRLTTARPKTPLGRTSSTATISTSAIVSVSSRPK